MVTSKILSFVIAVFFVGCTHAMFLFQTPFYSRFSLHELIERSKTMSGFNCTDGPGGGGGGASNGISAGGWSFSHSSKSEDFSCKLRDDRDFDEVALMKALAQTIEEDLKEAGARNIEHKTVDAGNFYFDYEVKEFTGKVQISGRRSAGNYYSLSATIDEKSGDAK